MDERRFDRLAKRLSTGLSRRQMLAGLGVAATGTLLGQSAETAPKPEKRCINRCNRTAQQTRRDECADLRNKPKNACLKQVATDRAECRRACRAPVPEV
jgi:hypothetical protein